MKHKPLLLLAALAVFAALLLPAHAVVEVKITLEMAYKAAHTVALGTVESVDAEKRVASISLSEILKAPDASPWAVGKTLRVQIAKPEALAPTLAKGDPIVLLRDPRNVMVHLKNSWLLATWLPDASLIRANGEKNDSRATFPGTTESLISALQEIKAGKSSLLNAPPAKFLATREKIAEGDKALALFPNPKLPPDADKNTLALATGKFDDANRTRRMALTREGISLLAEKDPPLPAIDTLQLLGSQLTAHLTPWKDGILDGSLTTCDANADGRDDALIVSSAGVILLLNRGFGGYLVVRIDGDETAHAALAAPAEKGQILLLQKSPGQTPQAWRFSTPTP